jgi:type II secretory pathway component PulF
MPGAVIGDAVPFSGHGRESRVALHLEMIGLGEATGSLDRALERATDVFQHELECRMLLQI